MMCMLFFIFRLFNFLAIVFGKQNTGYFQKYIEKIQDMAKSKM